MTAIPEQQPQPRALDLPRVIREQGTTIGDLTTQVIMAQVERAQVEQELAAVKAELAAVKAELADSTEPEPPTGD